MNSKDQVSGLNKQSLFQINKTVGVSKFRIYLLKFYYVVIIVLLGFQVWEEIFTHKEMWQPLPAVAYSFWGAFSVLAILGLIHPLKMIPLLLVQFSYKLIWLIIVAYPLWSAHQLTGTSSQGLFKANSMGVVIDLLVIPWPYVLKNFILNRKEK